VRNLDERIWKHLSRRANGNANAAMMFHMYVTFLECRPFLQDNTPNTAVHHILWRAEYPEYIKSKWNLIRLSNEDHTAAAALALSAEPHNGILRAAFYATYRIVGGSRRWRPENPAEVIRLYQTDLLSLKKLEKRFGVDRCAVKNFLKRNKVEIRDGKKAAAAWTWTPDNPEQVISLYQDNFWTFKEIGDLFNVSSTCIRNFILRNNIMPRMPGGYPRTSVENSAYGNTSIYSAAA
jgi:predicted DNA-binding protein YlxM (UPF0122 family)